ASSLGTWIGIAPWDRHSDEATTNLVEKSKQVAARHLRQATQPAVQSATASPLRLFLWTALVVGARSQLTTPFPAQFELSSLDGPNGFSLNGETVNERSGISVSAAGDL